MKMLKAAVIGKDVSKSVSPEIHSFIAHALGREISYEKISIPESGFESSIEEILLKYDCLNVTIPFKLSIIPHLNEICGDAKVFSAVNTITCSDRRGYNTDGLGFALMLRNNGVDVSGKTVLLLGAGGAGRSVAKTLSDAGAKVSVFDMNSHNAQTVADEFGCTSLNKICVQPYYLIVNATGVGMHKTEGVSPVGEELIKLCEVAVDLIYVPAKSRFLEIAESFGKPTINGEAMLFYQAYFAECIFFGLTPDDGQAKTLFVKYKENL